MLHLCSVHGMASNMTELLAVAERAERHYDAAGFSSAACIALRAEALYLGPTPVDDAARACLELLEAAGDRMTVAILKAVLGALEALAGRADDGRELLQSAREAYEDVGNVRGFHLSWVPLYMEVEALAGDFEAALATGRQSVDALEGFGEAAYMSSRAAQVAELLVDVGRLGEASEFVDRAEAVALSSDVFAQFASRSVRARILAGAGDLARAETLAREAVDIASLTDVLRDRARTHFALEEVLVRAGKPGAARTAGRAGKRLLQRKGAVALLERRGLEEEGAPVGAPSHPH